MTYITSYRNVISIEHTVSAVFVAFPGLLCRLWRKEEFYTVQLKTYDCIVFTNFDTQNYILFKIPAPRLYLKYAPRSYMTWLNVTLSVLDMIIV